MVRVTDESERLSPVVTPSQSQAQSFLVLLVIETRPVPFSDEEAVAGMEER